MVELAEPYATHLPPLVAAALAEDLPDLTSSAIFGDSDLARARLVAKAEGVVCGVPAFLAVLRFLTPKCDVESALTDGAKVAPGERVALIEAPAGALLTGERTALNFVMRLSGVATLTSRYVEALAGTGCTVLDTRKTTPGWRHLEKHAVRCGGGTNHRLGLYDAAMVKDTHVAACGSIAEAVRRVRQRWGEGVPLIVECGSLDEVEEALHCSVEHLLLDNMDLDTLVAAVAQAKGHARLEASGGVDLSTVRAIAETGVDFVSVGALTHSAPALDLSLKVET